MMNIILSYSVILSSYNYVLYNYEYVNLVFFHRKKIQRLGGALCLIQFCRVPCFSH